MTTAGERWGAVVESEAMEDGAKVEDGQGGAWWGVHFFSFLGGVESYLQSYPLHSYQKRGVFFLIFGEVFATIEVGLEKVGL